MSRILTFIFLVVVAIGIVTASKDNFPPTVGNNAVVAPLDGQQRLAECESSWCRERCKLYGWDGGFCRGSLCWCVRVPSL